MDNINDDLDRKDDINDKKLSSVSKDEGEQINRLNDTDKIEENIIQEYIDKFDVELKPEFGEEPILGMEEEVKQSSNQVKDENMDREEALEAEQVITREMNQMMNPEIFDEREFVTETEMPVYINQRTNEEIDQEVDLEVDQEIKREMNQMMNPEISDEREFVTESEISGDINQMTNEEIEREVGLEADQEIKREMNHMMNDGMDREAYYEEEASHEIHETNKAETREELVFENETEIRHETNQTIIDESANQEYFKADQTNNFEFDQSMISDIVEETAFEAETDVSENIYQTIDQDINDEYSSHAEAEEDIVLSEDDKEEAEVETIEKVTNEDQKVINKSHFIDEDVKPISEWKSKVEIVLESKEKEFKMLGYQEISSDDIWKCLVESKWKRETEKQINSIVQDIFHLQINDYMDYLTIGSLTSQSENTEELMESIQAVMEIENQNN